MNRAHTHLTTAAEARAADATALRYAFSRCQDDCKADWRCNQGRACDAVEQDLPLTGQNLLIAVAVIALAAFVSSLVPWGFAWQ